MEENTSTIKIENPELIMLNNNKETGFNYREPRHEPWRENYELYRDHVTINRFTQRQSVNLPLMKTIIRTILKDIDDMPIVEFQNLDNNKEADIFLNEYWRITLEDNNAQVQDIVDKKQNLFFGRTFDEWQIKDGKIKFDIVDPEDMLVDRFMNPYDLDSSRFLIHTHIFKPLSELMKNPDYDQAELKRLSDFYKTEMGIVKAQDNENSLMQKNKKMANLGVSDTEDPLLGETYVELTVHYVFRSGEKGSDGKEMEDQIFVYHTAEDMCILMKKAQEEIIGQTKDNWWKNHYRYCSWADDMDKQDFWTDAVADIVRTPNKIVNSWISQVVENRTLRNFGMHYYDSALKVDGFDPSTWQPRSWGWYGVPVGPGKKISDVFQKVDIPELSESLDEMNYVVAMTEKATGATTTQQGVQTEEKTTLGEVELALGEAQSRVKGMSKFYTPAWARRAQIFLKLIEAAPEKLDAVKVYKKGKNSSDLFTREISPADWKTENGWNVRVWSKSEKDSRDLTQIQKLQVLKTSMPDNPKLDEIYVRKLAEYADIDPSEVKEIMEFQKTKFDNMMNNPALATGQAGQTGAVGTQPAIVPKKVV